MAVWADKLITKKVDKVERNCRNCDANFLPSHASKGIFCSKPCKYEYARRNYREVKDGYIMVYPPHLPYPGSRSDGRILEHRLILQETLGRPLEKNETVHHKNGNTMDNRIENLQLRVGNHGKGSTHAHCNTCSCFKGLM